MSNDLEELLSMLESAGSGLALFELPRTRALTAPAVSGVSTFLPLTGVMYILQDGRTPLAVRAGQLALVPPGACIRLAARRSVAGTIDGRERLVQRGGWIVVPAPVGEEPGVQVAAARIIGSRNAVLSGIVVIEMKGCDIAEPLFHRLIEEVARGVDGHAGFAMALMNGCVTQAIRRDSASRHASPPTSVRAPRGAIARAIAAIRAHPGDSHNIESLAALAGMSRSSFLRAFGRATGATPQRYLQQVRLEEAAALLASTDLPIKIVAATTGFASRSHFSRAFRDAYARDPSAYRTERCSESVPV